MNTAFGRRTLFEVIALSPVGFPDPLIALAASAAGFAGGVALENLDGTEAASLLTTLRTMVPQYLVSIDNRTEVSILTEAAAHGLTRVIITGGDVGAEQIARLKAAGIAVTVEVVAASEAAEALAAGADALIVKGNEGGGRVGEETTFILLQQVLPNAGVPVYARGGIGLYTAAAALAAGAAGVVLDWQLALVDESSLPEAVKAKIGRMDGSETAILGQSCAVQFRAYSKPGEKALAELKDLEVREELSRHSTPEALARWNAAVAARVASQELLLIGQDACFAAPLAQQFRSLGAVCGAIRQQAFRQMRVAARKDMLREGSPLAKSHGTRYPILQGPMTRVSDRADFAKAVAVEGALPFLALALMRGPQVASLLAETKEKLGDLSWGVGILGFVPKELRDEQLIEVRKFKPPFAIIAGGRPDMAKQFEQEGTGTYLHVPSPELLRNFLEQGARRVIFEGRECGGHVGPRSSNVLWDGMIRVILAHLATAKAGKAEEYHFVFAGGIHDTVSAAMVSAIIAPLAERGVCVGVLLGTGYLFTEEAVSTGAIAPMFQREALECRKTILVESGLGHATRCADTAFGELFSSEKQRLLREGKPKHEIREALEGLNLGRLRIASKGIERRTSPDGKAVYAKLDDEAQRREGMYMIGQLAALRNGVTTIGALHAEVSRSGAYLRNRVEAVSATAMAGRKGYRDSDIAIVGFSSLFPEAGDTDTYWQNILHKRSAVTEVPKERWDIDVYFNPDRRAKDQVYSKWGGFIGDFNFDPLRFGMPPNTLRSIEPMQLIMLEMVHRALADAGYLDRQFNRRDTACIVGTGGGVAEMGQSYGFRSMLPHFVDRAGGTLVDSAALIDKMGAHLPEWTEDSFAGLLLNVVSGRVANRFDFGGTNYIVDAACATALAALRNACIELETRSSEVVVAASADMMQTAFGYLCFSKTQALSPTGQCRTFDETADGIVISEGFAVAILKRLDDAVMDGDRIYAVIKGVGASSDGRDKGLTAPRPIGQMRALDRAYRKAEIDPKTVGLIEAHGTGTVVGDRSEAESLTTFFGASGAKKASIAMGSVKSMVGHTKCSAGFAGLVKAAMALHYKVLPPTIGVTKPNSKARLEDSAVYINSEARPWLQRLDGAPRRAGVSAFGFGGTNFHVVMEEYIPDEPAAEALSLNEWPAELFLFRAKEAAGVTAAIDGILEGLAGGSKPALCELAAGVYWEHGRNDGPVCLAVVATSLEDLAAKLKRARAVALAGQVSRDPNGIYFSAAAVAGDGKVAFLFPGQGSQKTNMLRDLALVFPEVRRVFERADSALGEKLGQPLSRFIFPVPEFREEDKKSNEGALKATHVAQPALGAANLAMYALLQSLGISPAMAAGHSYGEFSALCAAGALSLDDLIRVSELRGRVIVESAVSELGTMAAIDGNETQVTKALNGTKQVWIANLNSPTQTVISGTKDGIESALHRLGRAGLSGRHIPVACAFHSELVAGAKTPLEAGLAAVEWKQPRFPVYSNTLARPHAADPAVIRQTLVEHLVNPVRFADEITAMYQDGARIFVECGPGNVLGKLTSSILAGREHVTVQMEQASRSGLVQLVHALGQLSVAGVRFFGSRIFEDRARQRMSVADLLQEAKPVALPESTWVIRNGRAYPAPEYRRIQSAGVTYGNDSGRHTPAPFLLKGSGTDSAAPAVRAEAPVPVHSTQVYSTQVYSNQVSPPKEVPMQDPNETPLTRQPDAPSNGRNGNDLQPMVPLTGSILEQALQGHHRLMGRFLDTHRQVMGALLKSSDLSAPATNGAHYPMELQPAAAVAQTAVARRPAPAMPAPAPARMDLAPVPAPVARVAPVVQVASMAVAVAPAVSIAVAIPAPVAKAAEPVAQVAAVMVAPVKVAPVVTRALITEKLVALVAQRTGYPPDMLGLDLDLEADLGVDSIKRVEILGALQNQSLLPAAAMEGEVENLSKLSTLQKIIDFIEAKSKELAGGPAEAGPPNVEPPMALAVASPTRMTVHIESAHAEEDPNLPFVQAVLITRDEYGVAQLIAKKLEAAGVPSRIVRNLEELDGAARSLGTVSHIIHLAALAECSGDAIAGILPRFERDVKLLYGITRHCAADLRKTPGSTILAATRMGGAFGFGGGAPDFSPASGGVAGFLKTVSREWPNVRARAVDFEQTASAEQIASALWAELKYRDGRSEVGYSGGKRVALGSVKSSLSKERVALRLDRDSVVLLTGGARGITADIALEIAQAFHPNLVLVGRSALPGRESAEIAAAKTDTEIKRIIIDRMNTTGQRPTPALVQGEFRLIKQGREMAANLAAMAAAGSRVEYHAANVCDSEAFGAVIDQTYAKYGRIDVVVHAAGVIEDKLIEDKTPESFERVIAPKIKGAQLLASKLRPADLKFLVFFSSVSARYGNRGQCDYAAANEVLNKMAVQLNHSWPGRVVSLDWGPWKTEGGMVSAELAERFAQAGVEMIEPPAGRKAFLEELMYGTKRDAEVIFGGPLTTVAQRPSPGKPSPVEIPANAAKLIVTSTQSDKYLLDHVIDGRPVLPMAMAMELMARTAAEQWPRDPVKTIRDVCALKGVTYPEAGGELTLSFEASRTASGSVHATLRSRDKKLLHYSSTIEFGTPVPASAAPLELLDHKPLPVTVAEVYRNWLFHGPLFAGIADIEGVGRNGIIGTLQTTPASNLFTDRRAISWVADPVLVDSGLQMIILWSRVYLDKMVLPARLGAYHRYDALSVGGPVRCEVEIENQEGHPNVRCQLRFFDSRGKLLAWMQDMDVIASKALNRLFKTSSAGSVQ